MTKPVGVNAKLAETCNICSDSILVQAYPDINHSEECKINLFLAEMEQLKMKRLDFSNDLRLLLSSSHSLPIREFKFNTPNGYMHGVYGPNWVVEGMNMYVNMGMSDLSLKDFLQAIMP